MAQITELITKFSFQGDTSPLNNFNGDLGRGIGLLAGFATAVAVGALAFNKWVSGVLQSEQPLIDLAAQTNVAVEAIQELGFAASVTNSSSQALNTSLEGLSTKIGEAAQKGSEDFSRLGISVRGANGFIKSTDQVLLEVGGRFKQLGLSMSEQQSFAEALGIDSSLLTLLNRSSSEIRNLRNEAREMGILTKEQTDQAMQYNDALTRMNFAMDSVRRLVAVGLAPELTDLAGKFTKLVIENKDWVINGIKATSEGIGNLLDALIRLAPFLGVVALAFVGAKIATLGFAGALGFLLSPALLIAAGIALALVVLDDLIVAFQGGKSVIRDFFLEFGFDIQPILVAMVDGFKEAFALLLDIGAGFIASLGGLFSGIGKLLTGDFVGAFDDIIASFGILVDTLAMMFRSVFGDVFEWLKGSISGLVPDWVKDLASGEGGAVGAGVGGRPDNSFLPGGTQALASGSTSIAQDVQINIRTSDPVRAGQSAAEQLQRQLEDAQTQTSSGRRGGM
jgi:hypothetical protein